MSRGYDSRRAANRAVWRGRCGVKLALERARQRQEAERQMAEAEKRVEEGEAGRR